ncbi:class I SAM-dependent methyltransferase [Bdellovibrio svalbardensis]|uniref:Class I SAM-dependent methyltransferase n=1 Tax=Bdellovibrio svalbardensis TaxID=2972972 RepID=A0ABT6DFP0_9BACT|nr:class I SAM-dependent methyltransferase [Bdellovibrio svalbardensis]MDG0815663.1 class I SAM-dependent methyltransferase [Bdellovibrio svalbardensis]
MSSNAMKQEFFHIDESTRKKVVRQDRTPLEPGMCYLDFHGRQFEVLNISHFGCAVLVSATDFPNMQDHFAKNPNMEADVLFKNILTQNLSLRWARAEKHSKSVTGEMIVGFEVIGEPFKMDRIKALEVSAEVIKEQTLYAQNLAQLPAEFKTFVYEMKDWLEKLKGHIDKLEADAPVDNWKEAQDYKLTIAETVSEYLGHVIPATYAKVPVFIANFTPEQMKWATEFARNQIGHLVYGAPFANRAYFKPRGYAGDYEMMNHLYRDELVGKTLFDQCMHKYFIDEPAGAAVKNRGQYLFEKITQLFTATPPSTPLKVMSVASGPAMEQQLFLQNSSQFYGRPAEFTCLDQDEESLKHAQRQLQSVDRFVKSGFNFKFNNMAIRNVIAAGLPEQNYDLIYSAGLFDYFTEPVAQMAAQKMLAAVKPGGRVIIGNFSKNNPCVPFMELILDWHLIYRSEEDLLRIFKGMGSKIWVEKEPLGVNLFVVIEK